jgi:seryl-tRNA synthetase
MFLLPVLLSAILLAAAAALFYISWHERQSEQQRIDELNAQIAAYAERDLAQQEMQQRIDEMSAQIEAYEEQEREQLKEKKRYEAMCAQVDFYIAQEREQLLEIVNRRQSYEEEILYREKDSYDNELVTYSFEKKRDSLLNLYDESDPLRDQFWQRWERLERVMYKEVSDYAWHRPVWKKNQK